PVLALGISSLQPFAGASEWSLRAHEALVGRRGLMAAVGRSVGLALMTAVICSVAAVVVGMLAERRRMRMAQGTSTVLSWPYLLPGSVLAMALILTLSRPVRFIVLDRLTITVLLAGTSWMLLVAYTMKHAAVALRPVRVALKGIGASLDEAARMSGARPLRAFHTGTAQALRPTLVASFTTVFLLSFSELTLSVLLVGPDTEVVGTVLFELHSYASPAESAALATWMTLVALVGFFGVFRGRTS
ncbi:MAG: ABC transporter permease subunit, partial [Myxococcota bacterium]